MAFFVEVATLQSHHATFVIVFHASSLVPVWANLHPLFLQDQAALLGPTQRLYWLANQSKQAPLGLGFDAFWSPFPCTMAHGPSGAKKFL